MEEQLGYAYRWTASGVFFGKNRIEFVLVLCEVDLLGVFDENNAVNVWMECDGGGCERTNAAIMRRMCVALLRFLNFSVRMIVQRHGDERKSAVND